MKAHIDRYIGYFHTELENVAQYNNRLHRKILYVTLLDTLARVVYSPSQYSNTHRFIEFVRNFSDWKDKDRVSLMQLKLELDKHMESAAKVKSRLYNCIQQRIDKRIAGTTYYASDDEVFDLLNELALDQPDELKAIKHTRYVELLYTYRNRLIHEYKEPGHALELQEDAEECAFNHSGYYSKLKENDDNWELCFPVALFDKLCRGCLDNLRECLYGHQLDPYSRYDFGDNWYEAKTVKKGNS